MARLKIAYVGGGSTRGAGTMASFVEQAENFAGSEIALIDLDLLTKLGSLVTRDRVPVAGRLLDRSRPGNDPDCVFLADGRVSGELRQPTRESVLDYMAAHERGL